MTFTPARSMTAESVITTNPAILGGTPVFAGTRVPVQTLIDYLEAGESLDDFVEDFPTVTRRQAQEVLELARDALIGPRDEGTP